MSLMQTAMKTATVTSTGLKIAFGVVATGLAAVAGLAIVTVLQSDQPAQVQTVSVPITLEELLPSGTSGWNRTNAVATFGVPLPQDANITNVNQLGLTSATAAQFREIRRWPNGSLQWVLVDAFVPTLAAGQHVDVSLTNGSGSFPAGNLAADGSTISVNTGTAQFVIRKSGFNVLDSATANARQFLTTGPKDGIWSLDDTGKRYTSANDPAPVVRIDENGPVRTVIRADGTLTAADGTKHFDYTLRMHFTRSSARVKLDLTVRNAESTDLGKKLVSGLGVQIPTNLTTSPQYTLPTNDATFSGPLGSDTATLFQAFAKNAIEGDYGSMVAPSIGTQTGVEVKLGATVLHALGSDQDWSTGWARLSDGTGAAVTVAVNHLSEFWPGGFELAPNGTADLQLYSPSNAANPLSFTWGAHDTRTLAVDFASAAPPAGDLTLAAVQYPLFGRASDYAYYGTTGAIFGATRLVTEAEYDQFIAATDADFGDVQCRSLRDTMLAAENIATVWRAKDWGKTGGPNQLDKSVVYFLDYLRTGKGGMFLRAYEESRYKADQAAVHCDDCDLQATWPTTNPNNWPWGDKTGGFNGGGVSGNTLESNRNHSHWPSMLVAWMLTGEQTFYDDTRDMADYLAFRENGEYGARNRSLAAEGFGSGGMRGWPNAYRDHALFAEYLNIPREWDALRFMTDQLTTTADSGTCAPPEGANEERGLVYNQSHMDCLHGRGNSFYHQHFMPLGMWEAMRVLGSDGIAADQTRADDLADILRGHAAFVTTEADQYHHDPSGSYDGWRTPYRLSFEYRNPMVFTTASGATLTKTLQTLHRADWWPSEYAWAYEQTGNALFLEEGRGLFCRMMQYEPYERGSDLASQEFIWTWLHRNELPGGFIQPQAQDLGGGSWRLSWTVPAGAVSYDLRSADKTIVEQPYFDQLRTDVQQPYLYPPDQYVSFWSASAMTDVPAPGAGGTVQTITISVPTGHRSFLIAYRTSRPSATDVTPPALTNVQPTGNVTAGTSFRFGLDTDEATTCKYGTTAGEIYQDKPSYFPVTGQRIHRSSSMPGLAPGSYQYFALCRDVAGNVSTEVPIAFTILPGSDTTPPSVTAHEPPDPLPLPDELTMTINASVIVTTSEAATCKYSTAAGQAYDAMTESFALSSGLRHTQPMYAFQKNVTYTFYVRCRDLAGNTMTGDATISFTPRYGGSDTTPPVITNVTSANVTQTTATITWATNEASDSQVEYGTTTAYGSTTTLGPALVTSHSQPLSGLTANTLYHVRVKSRDVAGNLATSTDSTFTTTTGAGDITPPVISGLNATNITATSASITWTTDESADSQVFYGLTTSYGSSTALDPALVTSHSQPLSGLTANTLYHYRVQSRDASGNLGTSTDQTFTTGAEPPGGSALYRIDFGKNAGVTIPDWDEVTLANLAFDASRGWGFVGDTSHIDAKERIYGDNVTKDYFVRSTSFSGPNDVTKQFKAVVPNGTYQVTITRGDTQYGADNIQNPFHYPMIVRENSGFEGQVPRSVLTRNPDSSYPVESEPFTITVSDGALDFTFTTDGICTPANDCGWGINALEIVPVVTSCTDGTALNACSVTKPKFCDNGTLINRCSQCGCPSGNSCQPDGSCVPTPPKKKHWYDFVFS